MGSYELGDYILTNIKDELHKSVCRKLAIILDDLVICEDEDAVRLFKACEGRTKTEG